MDLIAPNVYRHLFCSYQSRQYVDVIVHRKAKDRIDCDDKRRIVLFVVSCFVLQLILELGRDAALLQTWVQCPLSLEGVVFRLIRWSRYESDLEMPTISRGEVPTRKTVRSRAL